MRFIIQSCVHSFFFFFARPTDPPSQEGGGWETKHFMGMALVKTRLNCLKCARFVSLTRKAWSDFHVWSSPISNLACLFTSEVRISWKK